MFNKVNSNLSKRVCLLLSVLILLIPISCSPAIDQEVTTNRPASSTEPTATFIFTKGQAELSPTPVPPTATEPKPEFTATPEGGLHMVTGENREVSGEVRHLWVDSEGDLWVGTESGIYVQREEGWKLLYDGGVVRITGADTSGLVWVILEGEMGIAAYDLSGKWREYGAEQGWTTPPEIAYLSPGYGDGIATDPQGRVWLATGRNDVRYFDPETSTWHILSAVDLGFDPPIEEGYQGHFLSDVELSRSQKVWVGDCIGMGEGLIGQGVHWTDGEDWTEIPYTLGECVQDIERDSDGKMWVAGFEALLQYDPYSGNWTKFPLPPWDRGQLIVDITLDSSGNPWVEVLQFGGASPLGVVARYHLSEDEWVKDFEGWFSSLAVGENGVVWMCSEGKIYRLENGRSEEVGNVPGTDCQIAQDGGGRIWVMNFKDLWWFDPWFVNE